MDTLGYLLAAYAAVWVLIFAYTYSIAQRQRSIEQEIRALEQVLQDYKKGQA